MSLLNHSLEARCEMVATAALQVAASAASPSGLAAEAWESLGSKMLVLSEMSGAGWTPAFRRVLLDSHSMRITDTSSEVKRRIRSVADKQEKCMACGRWESNCHYKVDLVGPFDSAPFRNSSTAPKAWKRFWKGYEESFCGDAEDHGCFAVGETCLRRLQATFMANTLLMELCYDANQCLPADEDAWIAKTSNNLFEKVDKLERFASSKGDKAPPQVGIDIGFWEVIDASREETAREVAPRSRRKDTAAESGYRAKRSLEEHDDDGFIVSDSEESEEEEVVGRRDRGRRREQREETHREAKNGGSPDRKRACKRVVEDDEEEDELEHTPGTRRPPSSPRGAAGAARGAGALPARQKLVQIGFSLAASLSERGLHSESATVASLALTVQELASELQKA